MYVLSIFFLGRNECAAAFTMTYLLSYYLQYFIFFFFSISSFEILFWLLDTGDKNDEFTGE